MAKTNKKISDYFQVDDDKFYQIYLELNKKKDMEAWIVTCNKIKVTWFEKTYTKDKIIEIINKI